MNHNLWVLEPLSLLDYSSSQVHSFAVRRTKNVIQTSIRIDIGGFAELNEKSLRILDLGHYSSGWGSVCGQTDAVILKCVHIFFLQF